MSAFLISSSLWPGTLAFLSHLCPCLWPRSQFIWCGVKWFTNPKQVRGNYILGSIFRDYIHRRDQFVYLNAFFHNTALFGWRCLGFSSTRPVCKGGHPSSLKIDLEILNRLQKRKAVSGKLMYIICRIRAFACAGGVIICMLLVDFILSFCPTYAKCVLDSWSRVCACAKTPSTRVFSSLSVPHCFTRTCTRAARQHG